MDNNNISHQHRGGTHDHGHHHHVVLQVDDVPITDTANNNNNNTSHRIAARASNAPAAPGMCMGCKVMAIEYETATCHHPCFCKRCAMKCASGGKCKVCGQLYPNLRRVGPRRPEVEDEEEDNE
eukprot:PhM_4_TR1453/c0_g1_i1/m.8867